jgi:hypothetical protein
MCDICESSGIDYEARWPWAACARPPRPKAEEPQSDVQSLIASIDKLISALERRVEVDARVSAPRANRWSAS